MSIDTLIRTNNNWGHVKKYANIYTAEILLYIYG